MRGVEKDASEDLNGSFYVRHPLSTIESTLLSSLAESSRNIFAIDDVVSALDTTYENAKVIVNRLVKKAWLIRLVSGKYLIVPLEAGVKPLWSEHGFVIASCLVDPYYIGYGSALNYHGLTEYVPPAVFVVTSKRSKSRTILNTRFRFITVTESKMFGAEEVVISGRKVKVSDVEKTVADCLDHPEYCGGLDEVAKSIFFEYKTVDMEKVIGYAERMGNRTIIKRLGYLLELFGYDEYGPLFEGVRLSEGYSKLDPRLPKSGRINERWKLFVNSEINAESWVG
jgi:predicted transcriptional regulator of viral defense system